MNEIREKSENKLTDLQKKLLELFDWFHRFCEENQIRYYALGGTMLGAARHNGFIPWDDDIDVGIPRSDYEKLRELSRQLNDSRFKFEFPDSDDKLFATPYAKLYDTTTTLIENYRMPLKRGIFIDVFPLDGTGNDEKTSRNFVKQAKHKYNFFMTRVAALNSHRSAMKNIAIVISRIIPYWICPNRNLRIKIDKFAQKYDFNNDTYGGNIFGNWGYREIMKNSVLGVPTIYEFNGIVIYGVEHYDEYLTSLYGDWRKLPPKEKQVTHHDFVSLDLNKSYLE